PPSRDDTAAGKLTAKDIADEIGAEFKRFSEDAKLYKTEQEILLEGHLSHERDKISSLFDNDLKRLSDHEYIEREAIYARLKQIYDGLPNIEDKPDLLLKLQFL